MKPELERLKAMVGAELARKPYTAEEIRNLLEEVRQAPIFSFVTDDEAEKLAVEFETIHGVSMDLGTVLTEREFEKWLDAARSRIDPYYWNRYRQLLGEKGFSAKVLQPLDIVTDKIVGLLENPLKEGNWDRRGMVVGHVQSGKTANYTGVVCKAADAGYEVIIIIAGIHNNLRSQTQVRLDEGFTGFDSASLLHNGGKKRSIVGVGRFDSSRRPNVFTNSIRDFNKATATSTGIPLVNLNQPALFVIKKNSSTLKNLLEWLKEHNASRGTNSIKAPMLLIDDEADNASINIKKGSEEVSRINGQIRELLDIFDRSCYVGYTATPFANIFINPDDKTNEHGEDLFPRDFIVSLDPPDNYFGPARVFLSEDDSNSKGRVVVPVTDNEELLPLKHNIEHELVGLPESLLVATRAFVVAGAIRLLRGQERAHHSMLVNASRFTSVQRQLKNEIHATVERMRSSVRVNAARSEEEACLDPEIAALRGAFRELYENSVEETWVDVQARLLDSIGPITVAEINSRSSDSLDYDDHLSSGLSVIAVGGFSLSRGLTLEGLTVSYFLRNSMMYDTLMQMGRWFGYRPKYADLCRVWMPPEAEGWYEHIAESVEELRDEMRRMEAANATPMDFGLKVKSHPDTLIVTARNKMGSGEKIVVSIGLSNEFIETATLKRDHESLEANRNAANQLARSISDLSLGAVSGLGAGAGRLYSSVPAELVMDFLGAFSNHPGSTLTDTQPVKNYIEERLPEELSDWDVFFPSLRKSLPTTLVDNSLGFEIICQRRSPGRRCEGDPRTLLITDKQRVASRGVERVGLSDEEVTAARERYRQSKGMDTDSGGVNYPDRIYRYIRMRPLLVVHLLAIGSAEDDCSAQEPVIAWSISFPATAKEENKVEYVVNTTWFRERYLEESDDEGSEGDDD